MNIEEMIIDLFLKGHSINYITNRVYRRKNISYFNDYYKKGFINKDKYSYINDCRNLVEKTILKYQTNKKFVFSEWDTDRA